jgi:glutamate mutase epsilon subunit
MSKIALTPNASGTGTFTLAAPNSNTNRTITLPDSDGTLLASGSSITVSSATVNGTLDIEEVYEKVTTQTSTTGTITFDTTAQGVEFYTADQTANRTINFSNVNANLAIGQSVTSAILLTNGSTPYYLNTYQVDGSSVTPKWQGGTAPTEGNASSIDSYSFTIIKTADATFTVLASQTQFA